MDDLQNASFDGSAGDLFHDGERNVPAIEHWKWQQVEHRQIDVEQHHEGQNALPGVLGFQQRVLMFRDPDRPAEVVDPDTRIACRHAGDGGPHHLQALFHLHEWAWINDGLVHSHLAIPHEANHRVHVLRLERFDRRERYFTGRTGCLFYREGDGFPLLLLQVMGKLQRTAQRNAIDGENQVALGEASLLGWALWRNALNHRQARLVNPDIAHAAALEPLGFFNFKRGGHLQRLSHPGTFQRDADFIATAQDDLRHDGIERPHETVDRLAVDGVHRVAREDASLLGRAARGHESDLCRGYEILGFADAPDDHPGQKRQQHGKQRASKCHNDLVQRLDRRQWLGA